MWYSLGGNLNGNCSISKKKIDLFFLERGSRKRINLVDCGAHELASEDDVREEDAEVAARFRVPRLLVKHIPRDRHQIGAMRLRHVIHRESDLCSLTTTPPNLSTLGFMHQTKASMCVYKERYRDIKRKRERDDERGGSRGVEKDRASAALVLRGADNAPSGVRYLLRRSPPLLHKQIAIQTVNFCREAEKNERIE